MLRSSSGMPPGSTKKAVPGGCPAETASTIRTWLGRNRRIGPVKLSGTSLPSRTWTSARFPELLDPSFSADRRRQISRAGFADNFVPSGRSSWQEKSGERSKALARRRAHLLPAPSSPRSGLPTPRTVRRRAVRSSRAKRARQSVIGLGVYRASSHQSAGCAGRRWIEAFPNPRWRCSRSGGDLDSASVPRKMSNLSGTGPNSEIDILSPTRRGVSF